MSEMSNIYKWIEKENQLTAMLIEQIKLLHDHINTLQDQINELYTKVPIIEIK